MCLYRNLPPRYIYLHRMASKVVLTTHAANEVFSQVVVSAVVVFQSFKRARLWWSELCDSGSEQ